MLALHWLEPQLMWRPCERASRSDGVSGARRATRAPSQSVDSWPNNICPHYNTSPLPTDTYRMDLVRTSRALSGFCLVFLCASCGGGGSGDSSTQPPGSNQPPIQNPPASGTPNGAQPTFGVSTATYSFLSVHPNVTPVSQRIPVSFSGSVNGKLYIVASSDDSRITGASLTYTSNTGQTPTVDAFVVPAASSSLLAGTYTATITLTACVDDPSCQTGQLPGSPQKLNVSYTLRSEIQGDVIGPRVVTAGEAGTVIPHGRALAQATQVAFGSITATEVKPSELNVGAELRVKYPALPAGTYAVSINAGAIPFSASLVVVDRPNYAATALTYPSTPKEIGGVLYDAQRQAFYVAARYATSQSNTLFKYQFSGGAWQAPVAVNVPNLQDVALSPDGTTLLLATDTSINELDVATLAPRGTYSPSDELIRAGTAYIEAIAVANDGYAIVTTGGANPSNVLLYSTTTHEFLTVNSPGSNGLGGAADARLYFANAGVSPDGSLVVLSQDPRTAATVPPPYTKPFLYLYSATQSQRPSLFASPSSPFTDKDRSQSARSAKPAIYHADGVVSGTKFVIHGATPVVVSADYSARGSLPASTRASVFNPAGTLVYAFDAPAGSENGELRVYDVTPRLNPTTQMYVPGGNAVPMSPGSGTGAIAMTRTPDGGTLFIVGVAGVYVQPAPP